MATDEPDEAGAALHAGSRLSAMPVGDMFSRFHPLFGAADRLLTELPFQWELIRRNWTAQHFITLLMGALALLTGAWDLGVGELSYGGDIDHSGISLFDADSGISHVSSTTVFLLLLSLGLFIAFLILAWQHFPLMRGQAAYLLLAWLAADIGMVAAHASSPWFPASANLRAFGMAIIGNIILLFIIGIMVHRPVVETRDMHVIERHGHPDPRVMIAARRDHSLGVWTVSLMLWALMVNFSAWSGAHFVAPRPPFDDGRWLWYFVNIFSGLVVITLTMYLLWFPQMMLGGAGDAIETRRAREISRGVESNVPESVSGSCPECGKASKVERHPDGRIEIACEQAECTGSGVPREPCGDCNEELPSRIVCHGCGISTPVSDHFGEEAW